MKPRVKSLLTVAAVLAGVAWLTAGGDWPEPKKPQGPFGEPVRGAKLGLRAPTWLLVGQPFEVQPPEIVFPSTPLPPGAKSLPGINLLTGDLPLYSLELTDAKGQRVPFRVEQARQPAWPDLSTLPPIRLWPTEGHARGRYWKPGVYRLRAFYDEARNPMQPYGWYGKLISNSVRVEILEPDTPVPSPLRDPKLRKRIEDAIKNLDAADPATRQASQEALEKIGVVALPMLDASLPKTSPIARNRLEHVLRRITLPYTERLTWEMPQPVGPFLAGFDDDTWSTLKKHLGEPSYWFTNKPPKDWYGVRRARYAPLLVLSEKELVKILGHPEPEMRIRALRSLPRTEDTAALEKLIACLDDSYVEYLDQWGSAAFPVAEEAQEAIAFQGQKIVPLLLELAKRKRPQPRDLGPPREPYLREIIEILGKIGASEQSARFLDQLLGHEKYDRQLQAIHALRRWGRASVPTLLKVAQDDRQHQVLRRLSLEHLACFGTTEEVGHCLRSMLRAGVDPSLTRAAIAAIRKRMLSETVPDLKRIALDDDVPLLAREKAIEAVALLADKGEAMPVLQALLEPAVAPAARIHAAYYLGFTRARSAVPKLLELLEDEDGRLRRTADVALRAIADLPEGVGYDSNTGNAEPWRKWWQKQK